MNEHLVFKVNQTAALYVSGNLDDETRDRFELHLIGCSECIDDVETCRVLKYSQDHP